MSNQVLDGRGPRPRPTPTPTTEPFWDAARGGELALQRCEECGLHLFYPRERCSSCGSARLHWYPASGHGTVHTFTIARRPTHRLLASRLPYVIALIELDEGPRLTSAVVDLDPEEVRVGMRVSVAFEEDEEYCFPVFRAMTEEDA